MLELSAPLISRKINAVTIAAPERNLLFPAGDIEMASLPIGFGAKIGRAKEHLQAIKDGVSPFVGDIADTKAYSLLKEVDRQAGQYIFRIQINEKAPVVAWSLIIGDCFHNMRTALDHLYWALILKKHPRGLKKSGSSTNFPILRDRGTFKGRIRDIDEAVGNDVRAMLERLQPYNDPAGVELNPLMLIHQFDVEDKHRLLLPIVNIQDSVALYPKAAPGKQATIAVALELLDFEDGAVIGEATATPPENIVDMHLTATFDVVLDSAPPKTSVVPTLERLIGVVEAIGQDFLRKL